MNLRMCGSCNLWFQHLIPVQYRIDFDTLMHTLDTATALFCFPEIIKR